MRGKKRCNRTIERRFLALERRLGGNMHPKKKLAAAPESKLGESTHPKKKKKIGNNKLEEDQPSTIGRVSEID